MAAVVYLLCVLTSSLCALALILKYRLSKVRLLFWSAVCFGGLALNNILLFVDLVLTRKELDLSIVRTLPAVFGVAAIIWSFIWDTP